MELSTKNRISEFLESKGIEYYENKEIKPYLTIGIGGNVRAIIIVNEKEDLKELLNIFKLTKDKFVIIGGGSNIVFSENSPELFVIVNKISRVNIENEIIINVESGLKNKDLLSFCKKEGFCGLEFLAGIPGTIGGAAVVNAGAYGKSMSDVVMNAEAFSLTDGFKIIDNGDFKYSYRNSKYKYCNDVILSIRLKVKKCSVNKVKSRITEILSERSGKHPYGDKTAGCFFKNPIVDGNKVSAGKLMEEVGLKDRKFGKIRISDIHSNFIINDSNASFDDIKRVEKELTELIVKKTGVLLEREIIYIKPDGKKE